MGAAWSGKSKATTAATSPAPPWPDLPPEAASLVLRHLPSPADRFCFAAVCRQWEHVARRFWSVLPPELVGLATICRRWRRDVRRISSRWSDDPPSELADLVLRRLGSHADRVRFASACRHWRHAATLYSPAPLPPALPWLASSDGAYDQSLPDGEVHHFLRRRERDDLICHGSFDNWLLLKETGGGRRRFLENPLTGAAMELPGRFNEPLSSHSTSPYFDILKVILCSTADLAAAVVRYGNYQVVVCCRPGKSSSWSTRLSRGSSVHHYQDMAFHNGKVYAVANGGDLYEHEISEDTDTGEPRVSRIKRVIAAAPSLASAIKCYLVRSCTSCKLLLVRWFLPCKRQNPRKGWMLTVFEADFDKSQWVEVERLDDQIFDNCGIPQKFG
ncbi:hypothetical protein C2845_PM17G13180 [Panicum miliaceum]|uniref:Uncharacterized protein n=1 Tax=Panicum miliaceum TaxID=4540 RepID=A0A3L6Q5G7_PANMI|nr:hypothetical protein C2845_PM17G13180 [Panicum miliaceum]